MKLRTKFVQSFISVTFIPVCLFIVIISYVIFDRAKIEIKEKMITDINHRTDLFKEHLKKIKSNIKFIANLLNLQELLNNSRNGNYPAFRLNKVAKEFQACIKANGLFLKLRVCRWKWNAAGKDR